MSKSSRPDRKPGDRGGRGRREPSEYAETTLSVDRVTRVVKGGRRMRFRAIVVVGNRKGKVGMGTGKANEVQAAVQKATKDAKRHLMRVPLLKGTIPHEVDIKFKAAKLRILPASEGTGIIAGGALRVIFDHAGIRNVLSKRFGTGNTLVNAQATFRALKRLRPVPVEVEAQEQAQAQKQAAEGEQPVADVSAPQVREVKKKDVSEEGTLKG